MSWLLVSLLVFSVAMACGVGLLLLGVFDDKDIDLCIKNLKWWRELDRSSNLKAIIAHDTETPAAKLEVVKQLASEWSNAEE